MPFEEAATAYAAPDLQAQDQQATHWRVPAAIHSSLEERVKILKLGAFI